MRTAINLLLTLFFLILAILEGATFKQQTTLVMQVLVIIKMAVFGYIMLYFSNKVDDKISK
jgi:hypothetical protein